ncbi:hypothetical protein ACLSZW_01985 [Avibacterium avium]|uniref:hypothetical protein n=1 Tax=Avibacterium avium TaxID=751 RepID=UPI003BF7A4EC
MHQEDLALYRGDDTTIKVAFTTDEGDFIIEGGVLEMEIRPKHSGTSVRLSSVEGGISLLNANTAVLHFSHAFTQNWTWKKADYDLQLTKDDTVKTLVRGQILLTHDITK